MRRSLMETVELEGFGQCVRLANADVELLITLELGPRIMGYRFLDGENVMGEFADRQIETEIGVFSIYGGHRLWIAPENWPVTYSADDAAVEVFGEGNMLTLVQQDEPISKTRKSIVVTLAESGSEVMIDHEVEYLGDGEVELSPWALTIMRPGGVVVIPNEPFAGHAPDRLLPVRTLAVWSYTQLNDPRFSFDEDALRIRVDETMESSQKIGVLNRQAVCHYELPDVVFTKHYGFDASASYPDFGVNTEIYTAGNFVEIETLGALQTLQKGEVARHREVWSLARR